MILQTTTKKTLCFFQVYSGSDTQSKSKVLAAWQKNHHWSTKDFKPNKCKILKKSLIGDVYKNCEEHRDPTCLRDLMIVPQKMPQYIDATHCLAVSKILLKFIITMDHSGSADMMLLSFKVRPIFYRFAKYRNEDFFFR